MGVRGVGVPATVAEAVVGTSAALTAVSRPESRAGSSHTTSTAPESSSWWAASASVKVGLTGVTAAPAHHAPKSAMTSSTRLGSMTATMSPRLTPSARNRCAKRPAQRRSSSRVSAVRSSASAGRSIATVRFAQGR